MKSLVLFIVVVMLNLVTGCATCRQSSDAQVTSATKDTSWWQYVVGFFGIFALESAHDMAVDNSECQAR